MINNMVVTSMHMMEGMCRIKELETVNGTCRGWLELTQELSLFVPLVDQIRESFTQDFPGVFDYEVSYSFGEWYGQFVVDHQGHLPAWLSSIEQMQCLSKDFFNQTPGVQCDPIVQTPSIYGNFTLFWFPWREDGVMERRHVGYFEHNSLGEDCSGGLWASLSDNIWELEDYDGVFALPSDVFMTLRKFGIQVSEEFSD